MEKRYLVLLPQGAVASKDDASQDACLGLALRCCEESYRVIVNPTRDLNPYMDRLEKNADAHAAPARVVIVLTVANPISAIFRAWQRLTIRFPHFENALWAVYVETFADSFLSAAKRFGTLNDDMEYCPQWRTADYGTFLLFTPRTIEGLVSQRAKAHWRNVDLSENGTPSQKRAIHPPPRPSRNISVHMPRIAAPASGSSLSDPLFKKP